MNRYAVGYANKFEDDLTVVIVHANSEKEALLKHPEINNPETLGNEITRHWLNMLPNDMEEIKERFFQTDVLVDVTLVDSQ